MSPPGTYHDSSYVSFLELLEGFSILTGIVQWLQKLKYKFPWSFNVPKAEFNNIKYLNMLGGGGGYLLPEI